MVSGGKRCCPVCGAHLRRARGAAGECDPCRRAAPARALVVDPVLWDEPGLSAALARLEFGPVFRRVRTEHDWSAQRLAALLDLDQSTLSKIEKGQRSLNDVGAVIRCANLLGIPPSKLGFAHEAMVGSGAVTGREGSGVDRRTLMEKVAALTFGAAAATVDIPRLVSLFPGAEPTGTRHVGAADVEALEAATAAYRAQDFAQGAGQVREVALAHLRATVPLLDAQMTPEVQPRLYLATAHLAMMTGWLSFDVERHDAARRLWLIGLEIARATDHPLAGDLTAYLVFDMAIQSVDVGHPDEAVKLVHLGHAAAGGSHPVSAATASSLWCVSARAHAAQGDARACDLAAHQAQEQFANIDHQTRPPWGTHLDDAGLASWQGSGHYALALTSHHPRAAHQAVVLLRQAVDGFGPDYTRRRALYLPDLAGAHALAGDLDTAVSVGHQAMDAVTAVHSPRAHNRLHRLHTVLAPLHTSPGVAELRKRLTTTAT